MNTVERIFNSAAPSIETEEQIEKSDKLNDADGMDLVEESTSSPPLETEKETEPVVE